MMEISDIGLGEAVFDFRFLALARNDRRDMTEIRIEG